MLPNHFPGLAIDVVSWRINARGLVGLGQGGECLLHLLGEMTGNEPCQRLQHGLLQPLSLLLQTEEEALYPRALLVTRLPVQEPLHTGALHVYIACFPQSTGEAPQRLPPALTRLPRE